MGVEVQKNDPLFQEKLNSEKLKRLGNMPQPEGASGGSEKVTTGVVDPESFVMILKRDGRSDEQIEGVFTRLDSDIGKVCSRFSSEFPGPYATPQELAKEIGNFIKRNFTYDLIVYIRFAALFSNIHGLLLSSGIEETPDDANVLDPLISEELKQKVRQGLKKKGIHDETVREKLMATTTKEEAENVIKGVLLGGLCGTDFLQVSNKTLEVLRANSKYFETNKDRLNGLPQEIQVHIVAMQTMNFQEDGEAIGQIKDYIIDNITNPAFLMFVQEYANIDITTEKRMEEFDSLGSAEKLLDYGVGVCRDYAAMMKAMYNHIIETSYPNRPESEMVFVLNPHRNHAYNMLVTEDKSGNLVKEYYDPTSYIMGGQFSMGPTPNSEVEEVRVNTGRTNDEATENIS